MDTSSAPVTLRELGTLPNVLSLVRVPMAAVIWVAPENTWWLLGWMAAAGVSDLLDGYFARRAGLPKESIGAWLDPLCDKVFVLSVLVAVWVMREPPLWMALVASLREAVLLPLVIARVAVPRFREAGIPWRSLAFGKATTVAQFGLFAAVLADVTEAWAPMALISGILGVASGAQYAARAWDAVHRVPTPRPSI